MCIRDRAKESLVSSIADRTKDERTKNEIHFPTEEILTEEFSKEKCSTEELSAERDSTKKISVAADILKTSKPRKIAKSGKEHDPILFERLKALRKEIALKKNLPPYIIFSDTTLKEMATRFPQSPEEFHSITGVGDHKLQKYGDVFLKEIRDYCNDYGLIPAEKSEASGDREI